MQGFSLSFEYSAWWVLLFILLGLAYSLWLYHRDKLLTSTIKKINIFLRTLAVALLLSLLLDPSIQFVKNDYEKEGIVIALDNSLSVGQWDGFDSTKVKNDLIEAAKSLTSEGYEVFFTNFQGHFGIDSLQYNAEVSDIGKLINESIKSTKSENIGQVVLFSDGIVNRGYSPEFTTYFTPVHTVGMGDTLAQIDVAIRSIIHNKLVYLNNKFVARGEFFQNGFDGQKLDIQLQHKGKVLSRKDFTPKTGQNYFEIDFIIDPIEAGYQYYDVEIRAMQAEKNMENNTRRFFVEVVEGKQKVLMLAASPHPDLKAITSALDKNELYEISQATFGLVSPQELARLLEKEYDLVIIHQFTANNPALNAAIKEVQRRKLSILWIPTSNMAWNPFNSANGVITVQPIRNQVDMVTPFFNSNFKGFQFEESFSRRLNSYNPIQVPFARWTLKPGSEIVLYQKVGSLETDKPFLVINKSLENREAVWFGEGLWQWRIQEMAGYENAESFDQLLTKTVQLIVSKDDKRRFKVYPKQQENLESAGVSFITEIYNEILEPIYGNNVNLTIKDEEGASKSYQYNYFDGFRSFEVKNLSEGLYTYVAETTLDGKNAKSEGSFVVRNLQLEMIDLKADHQRLKDISQKSQGLSVHFQNKDQVWEYLKNKGAKSKILSTPEVIQLRKSKLYILLIVILFASEWFLRKYFGII